MTDTNKEIEDILNESPLIDTSKPKKIKSSKKKVGNSKKKMILVIIIILVVIGGFILIKNITNCDTAITGSISNTNFINSIKQQIIEEGYAEIGEGDSKIILSPYIP